jgi:alanyl-tRNA synthetase
VIADHLRAVSFLMADGVMPSNEGRGYVLRRIMRRAMRHAHLLGARDPLLYRLFPQLNKLMGAAYPELTRASALITETLKLEETRFKQMLDRGLKLLDDETNKLSKGTPLAGEVAFKLYDTFGFPLDLTQDVLRGRGGTVDTAGFEAAMQRQKAEARKSWSGAGGAATSRIWFDIREELGASDFLGYSTEQAEGQVQAILKDGARVDAANIGDQVAVILNQTPFYGEQGGQAGDQGIIRGQNFSIRINDTKKEADGLIVHLGVVEKGSLKNNDAVFLEVDHERRAAIRANHSATHLMHEALRRVLGEHVTQKGSLVTNDRLRFDISQPTAIKEEQLREVENIVNARIRANDEVITRVLTPEAAIAEGAMALFGEKYDEEVRVLSMGGLETDTNKPFSMELCGGTHVRRAGDIGLFKIISEGAVAAGIRRIEAVTGTGALIYLGQQEKMVKAVADTLRANPADMLQRLTALMDERKKLERDVSDLRRQLAMSGGGAQDNQAGLTAATKKIGDISFASRIIQDMPAKDLKPMADAMRQKMGSGVIALASIFEGKVALVVSVTADLTTRINAVDLAKMGAQALGGSGGGGRPDMAQAGGNDPDKAHEGLAVIETALQKLANAA